MAHLGFRTHEWISSWWFSAEMPNVVEKNQHVNSYNHACASGSFFTHWVWLHFEVRVWCGNAALDDGGEKCWVKSWHVLWATRLAPPLTDVLPNMITTPLEGSNNPTCSLHRAILRIFNVIFLPNYQPTNLKSDNLIFLPFLCPSFRLKMHSRMLTTSRFEPINLALTFYTTLTCQIHDKVLWLSESVKQRTGGLEDHKPAPPPHIKDQTGEAL